MLQRRRVLVQHVVDVPLLVKKQDVAQLINEKGLPVEPMDVVDQVSLGMYCDNCGHHAILGNVPESVNGTRIVEDESFS